jgi:DNA-binding response OmpR family regulator|tara:strand:- start:585 stop:1523 length:939 start_codon:yes stop_codon:yes gene_type:complete
MAELAALVVDDAGFIRDMVKKSVRREFANVDVDLAPNGKKAQKLLKEKKYDLVLCDWEMPEMDGDELLRWVRAQEDCSKTPFVMVTSRGEKSFVVKAAEAGVNGYLTKPFTNEQLVQTVTKIFKKTGKLASAKGKRSNTSTLTALSSVSALTGTSDTGARQANAAETQNRTTQSESSRSDSGQAGKPGSPKAAKKIAQLRYGDEVQSCVVREITLEKLHALIKPDDKVPSILEQTVVHLVESDGTETVQLNGYVQSLVAVEAKLESQFVNIVVRFVDQDQQKLEGLSHYITGTPTRGPKISSGPPSDCCETP